MDWINVAQGRDQGTIIYHPGLVQWASSGRGAKWTQSHPIKINNKKIILGAAHICSV
jgi:hypothetical protein